MAVIWCPIFSFGKGDWREFYADNVPCDDIDALEQEILCIAETKPYSLDACLNKAKEFDMNERFEEYVKLYEKNPLFGTL